MAGYTDPRESTQECIFKFIAPIDLEGFGQCELEVEHDVCQYRETVTLDFFVEDGKLNVYEAEAEPENPEDPIPPKPDKGPESIFCDPCFQSDSYYVGFIPDLFTVGGEGSAALYCGSVEVVIVPAKAQTDDEGKEGKKAIVEDTDGCCCSGSPASNDKKYLLAATPVTLGELRGNVNNRPLPTCDDCGCEEEDQTACYGDFSGVCPALADIIEVLKSIESTNCA